MRYDDILAIARRGEAISNNERTQLDDYMATHPERCSDINFEKELAATIAELPTVTPSINFVDAVLAKLPIAPIHLPAPSFNNVWQWVAGSVGAGAASSMAAWHWREVWLGWLSDVAPTLAPEPGALTVSYYSFLGALGLQTPNIMTPTVIVGALIALGAFAWGAISFAEERR